MKIYEITFGSHTLRYAFHYEKTPKYMLPYIRESESEEYDILAPLDYMDYLRPFYPENPEDAYVEYKSLINLSSLALLKKNAVFYHAVAFRYQGKAWLFTGRSGAGKTTQYKNWKKHFGKDIELICGDMPYLEPDENGEFMVYPSPWNGKERIKGKAHAPLGGLILLEKSNHNEIRRLPVEEAMIPIFRQFAVDPETEEDIRRVSSIADLLLRNYPVLKLSNKADEEAVLLLEEALKEYL